ncbi:MAG: hypothetical protein GY941_21995 [Planctomycetes bacterium]|nr:hypothetical protein [Planctomycetota bacterium]
MECLALVIIFLPLIALVLEGIVQAGMCWFRYIVGKPIVPTRWYMLKRPRDWYYSNSDGDTLPFAGAAIVIAVVWVVPMIFVVQIIMCCPLLGIILGGFIALTLLLRFGVWTLKTLHKLAKLAHKHEDTEGVKLDNPFRP